MNGMVTVAYNTENNCFYSGSTKGGVYQWNGRSCSKHNDMHKGSVRGLQWSNGVLLSSGSKDNCLKISKDFEVLH